MQRILELVFKFGLRLSSKLYFLVHIKEAFPPLLGTSGIIWEWQTGGLCRLSWLTNNVLVYEPKCGGRGGVAGSQSVSTAVHRSPNKLGYLTPYLTCAGKIPYRSRSSLIINCRYRTKESISRDFFSTLQHTQ